jgi:hypothetical protein
MCIPRASGAPEVGEGDDFGERKFDYGDLRGLRGRGAWGRMGREKSRIVTVGVN